jgi:hypothetical protein
METSAQAGSAGEMRQLAALSALHRFAPARAPRLALALSLVLGLSVALLAPAAAWGLLELKFILPPALPPLPALALNARAQADSSAMTPFSVEDLRLTKSGWNLTAQGQSATGHSPVFAQYCPKAKCGSEAEGYVAGGATLPADSLTLNSTGASFSGGLGVAPTLECASGCPIDHATPVKIASDATGLLAGEGIWTSGGFSANSLSLATPSTLRALPNEEIYRVNVLWTLSTGP